MSLTIVHLIRPLRIRTDIRDKWDPESSTIQKATAKLSAELGLKAKLIINWDSLWADLEAKNSDRTTFIPLIESVALLWIQGIIRWLEDEKWGEELLEKLSAAKKQQLELFILVRTNHHQFSPVEVFHGHLIANVLYDRLVKTQAFPRNGCPEPPVFP